MNNKKRLTVAPASQPLRALGLRYHNINPMRRDSQDDWFLPAALLFAAAVTAIWIRAGGWAKLV